VVGAEEEGAPVGLDGALEDDEGGTGKEEKGALIEERRAPRDERRIPRVEARVPREEARVPREEACVPREEASVPREDKGTSRVGQAKFAEKDGEPSTDEMTSTAEEVDLIAEDSVPPGREPMHTACRRPRDELET
jgi:hypothetical protein